MADTSGVVSRLFEHVMAPLVLGGAVAPGHAIGARAALALGDRPPPEGDLAARVAGERLRRARRLAPVDPGWPSSEARAADWAIGAAFHDIALSLNPAFSHPLRRRAGSRLLAMATAALAQIARAASAGEALARHTWFARVLDVRRIDTTVSWWLGSQRFFGVSPPARLTAWPELRRVQVDATPRSLLELTPIAVDREQLTGAVAALLGCTPLTDVATCARSAPAFTWNEAVVRLISRRAGQALALRALDREAPLEVDAALGRASRTFLAIAPPDSANVVLGLLAERVLRASVRPALAPTSHLRSIDALPASSDALFSQSLGAYVARQSVASGHTPWPDRDRRALLDRLEAAAANLSPEARTLAKKGGN